MRMSKFYVLSLGEFIHKEGVEVTLESFADLYFNVTSKHQKQMKLGIVTKGTLIEFIKEKATQLRINHVIDIIPWSEQELIEKCYKEASIMLLPSTDNISKLVSEAFSFGLPVTCYDFEEIDDIVDASCGMMIRQGSYQQNISNFSEILRMLYFDPEARKILKKGALKKYEMLFSWGYSKAS